MAADRALRKTELPYFHWQVAGKPPTIFLKLELVDQIRHRIRAQGPNRELIGILLGYAVSYPSPGTFVDACEFLPAAADGSHLGAYTFENAIATLSRSRHQYPVGFFRTQTAGGLILTERDFATAKEFFHEPGNVALVVRRGTSDAMEGGFFIWEDGAICPGPSYREFPFDSEILAAPNQPLRNKPEKEPAPASAAPAVVASSVAWLRLLPTALLATVAVAATQYAVDSGWHSNPEPKRQVSAVKTMPRNPDLKLPAVSSHSDAKPLGPLGLTVAAGQGFLDIDWSQENPAILKAQSGVLTLEDGGIVKALPLDKEKLRHGQIVYPPLSTEVVVRLQVTGPGGDSKSQSTLILTNGALPPGAYNNRIAGTATR